MRFKVDESLHVEIADLLRERGQDALTVFDQKARGRSDRDIADLSRTEGRVLISLDLDFSNILIFPPEYFLNFFQYIIRILKYLPVLESEYGETKIFKMLIPDGVFFYLDIVSMWISIEFNY